MIEEVRSIGRLRGRSQHMLLFAKSHLEGHPRAGSDVGPSCLQETPSNTGASHETFGMGMLTPCPPRYP